MGQNKVAPDDRPGFYYVSILRWPEEYRLIAGPFSTHAEALATVDAARLKASEVDARAYWYGYGTARCEEDAGHGILNQELGLRGGSRTEHGKETT